MSSPRNFGRVLLRAMARLAPARLNGWAEAMLSELEAVDGEWEALRWALGSVAVVMRAATQNWVLERARTIQRGMEATMEGFGRKAGWLVLGALGTVALSLAALGALFAVAVAHPQLGLDHAEWTHVVFVIVLPLTVSLVAAVSMWRRRRPASIGILVAALVIGTHVVVHFATR